MASDETLPYDPLILEDPRLGSIIKAKTEEARAEGKAEGLAEGEAKGWAQGLAEGKAETIVSLKNALFDVAEARFPTLASRLGKAVLPETRDELASLLKKVANARNEQAARQLLGLLVH
jgi:flagellar biosynthesis/type III secretory pathway protein FliH